MIVIVYDTIHVVDAIMGTGKTQACIAYMRQHPDRRYMYVTPYLDECQRIQASAPELDFMEPQADKTKSADLLRLLSEGRNITLTHELFRLMNDSYINYIKKFKYTLMLDEELSCVESIQIPQSDLALMLEKGLITVDPATKAAKWTCSDDYTGKLTGYKDDIRRKPVYLVDRYTLMWLFPLDVLTAFDSVCVLTFMFASSTMAAYLVKNGIQVDYYHVCCMVDGAYQFAPGYQAVTAEEKKKFKRLIEIDSISADDKWRSRAKKGEQYLLSKSWFAKSRNQKYIKQLKKTAYNFVRNRCKASVRDVLWTSYKDSVKDLKSDKMTVTNWLAWNTKATNNYSDRSVLVYLLNVFPIEPIRRYLEADSPVKFNEDEYALSQMLQWIYRSAVRNGQPVRLYIPAPRMRQLLTEWLNG